MLMNKVTMMMNKVTMTKGKTNTRNNLTYSCCYSSAACHEGKGTADSLMTNRGRGFSCGQPVGPQLRSLRCATVARDISRGG